jgi:hypothetical protein
MTSRLHPQQLFTTQSVQLTPPNYLDEPNAIN